jgi:hypothetical protein
MRDASRFGAATTADEALEGVDLHGRLVLLTGGSSGLGQESARALAAKGAHVVLTARDLAKGRTVAEAITASTGNRHIELEELELGSLASIRAFAARFLARHDRLDVLVNNAGVHAYALHPGAIMTELARHLVPEDVEFLRSRTPPGTTFSFKSVEAGAATSVFAATAPELEGRGGVYLEDCHVATVNDAPNALDGVKTYAIDPRNAERLWQLSERLVGERFALA